MKLIIRTETWEQHKVRVMERAGRLTRGEHVEPEKSLSFETPVDLLEFLTVERFRLFEMTRQRSLSISGLAEALDRDPSAVRRDVKKLVEFGVLRTREKRNPGHGRMKIVEPTADSIEIRAEF
jgi:predicted transcriptional regulator